MLKNSFNDSVAKRHCGECGTRGPATRTTVPETLPKLVLLRVKRFAFDNAARKLFNPVALPATVRLFDREYSLCSFVEHNGDDVRAGHYTCSFKSDMGWVNANDEALSSIRLPLASKTVTQMAFIRVDATPEVVAGIGDDNC